MDQLLPVVEVAARILPVSPKTVVVVLVNPVLSTAVSQLTPFWAVEEAVKTLPLVPTPSNAQPAEDDPTISPPVVVANPWMVSSLGETLKVMVCPDEVMAKKLAFAVEVESVMAPEMPETVVVVLKLGLALVIVTAPVAPLRVMPDPATAEVTTGV